MTTEIDAEGPAWPPVKKAHRGDLQPITMEAVKDVQKLLEVYAPDVFDIEMTAGVVSRSLQAAQKFPDRTTHPTTHASEAEPVACADCGAKDPFMYPCHQQGCPHSPTPASDDQVEAVRDVIADLEWVHRQGGLGYRIHDKLEKCISALAAMGSTKP